MTRTLTHRQPRPVIFLSDTRPGQLIEVAWMIKDTSRKLIILLVILTELAAAVFVVEPVVFIWQVAEIKKEELGKMIIRRLIFAPTWVGIG